MPDHLGLFIAVVVMLGAIAQWVAWRLRLPAIVLLSAVGVLIGPVFGVMNPSDVFDKHALEEIVGLAVAIILFEGGLNLRKAELSHAAKVVRRLTSVGVVLGWLFGTLASHYIGGLMWETSAVLGALLVVTGPTVIVPLLRQAGLDKKPASYLKWEGIINDPIGVLLAVIVFQFFVYGGTNAPWEMTLLSISQAIGIAILLGGVGGYLLGRAFRSGAVPEYLKYPIVIAFILFGFTVSNLIQHEAGLMTVTIAGVVMGNMNLRSIEEMRRFKEYLTILLVSTVFILLTANLDANVLDGFTLRLMLLVLAFMFIVRPLAVWLATIGTGASWQERLLVGWVAPRGIVAAATAGVFAGPMIKEGYTDAVQLVPVTFALIFVTVVVHGFTVSWVGRRLGLSSTREKGLLIVGASPWTTAFAETLKKLEMEVIVADGSWHRLSGVRQAEIRYVYGEILSHHTEESLELSQYANLLVATSNDAYNALVCSSFAPELGRNHVYQLPMMTGDSEDPRNWAGTKRGLPVLEEGLIYEELWLRHNQGWSFKKTRLTEEYGYAALRADLADNSVEVALLSDKKGQRELQLASTANPFKPEIGDTVITYVPPTDISS